MSTQSLTQSVDVILGQPEACDQTLLTRFHFAHPQPERLSDNDWSLTLTPADDSVKVEQWWVSGPVSTGTEGEVRISANEQYMMLEYHCSADAPMQQLAKETYDRLFAVASRHGYPNFIKFWNHVPAINEGGGESERYKQFCLGRGESFDQHCPQLDSPPAATAVGGPAGSPLQVVLLAGREMAQPLENPRQVAAYHYPRQYGPRSPTFARAALAPGGQVFVSGTAAVVGHESRHTNNLEAQIAETIVNWRHLLSRAAQISGTQTPAMDQVPGLRVYVREPGCLQLVRRLMRAAGVSDRRAIYLNADICRRELLFEMDGLANCRVSA